MIRRSLDPSCLAPGRGGARLDGLTGAVAAAGPPFPEPVDGQAVYDTAGILSPAAIASAEATIDTIEERTGAEIVVYSQLVDYGVTTERDRGPRHRPDRPMGRRARRVRRRPGDLLRHRPLARARPGPALRGARLRGDLPDEQRTAADLRGGHAAVPAQRRLRRRAGDRPRPGRRGRHARERGPAPARAPGQCRRSGSSGPRSSSSGWSAGRSSPGGGSGRIPVYLDDPSILMPAPPPDLTAASGAFVMDGGTSRRALTTAMLDLASRGYISFREDEGLLGLSNKVGIDVGPPAGDPRRGGAPGAQCATADRPGRGVRPQGTARARGEEGRVHRRGRPARVRQLGVDVRLEARVPRRQAWLGGRQTEQGRRPLDDQGRARRGRRRGRPRRSASASRSPGSSSSACAAIAGGIVIGSSPAACRRSPWPAP